MSVEFDRLLLADQCIGVGTAHLHRLPYALAEEAWVSEILEQKKIDVIAGHAHTYRLIWCAETETDFMIVKRFRSGIHIVTQALESVSNIEILISHTLQRQPLSTCNFF